MKRPLVSVIAPVFNEEAVIAEFVGRVTKALEGLVGRYDSEIVLVDDGSRDRTLEVLKELSQANRRLRVLELRRNYGQTAALQAGIDAARGDILVTLDSDLQHFPEEIPAFLARLEEGYDVVCGWRSQRAEGVLRRWPSRAANLLLRWLSGIRIHDFGTTFRAYRAALVKELRLLGEFHRYIPVLAHDAGGRVTEMAIRNIERPAGRSRYGLARTYGVSLDLVLLFFLSRYIDRPLRAFGKLALLGFATGGTILGVLLVIAYTSGVATVRERSGWFQISVMLLLASVQTLLAGLLAEIMVRVQFSLGDRRVYSLREEWAGGLAVGPRGVDADEVRRAGGER